MFFIQKKKNTQATIQTKIMLFACSNEYSLF
jgi:hypothetical protein